MQCVCDTAGLHINIAASACVENCVLGQQVVAGRCVCPLGQFVSEDGTACVADCSSGYIHISGLKCVSSCGLDQVTPASQGQACVCSSGFVQRYTNGVLECVDEDTCPEAWQGFCGPVSLREEKAFCGDADWMVFASPFGCARGALAPEPGFLTWTVAELPFLGAVRLSQGAVLLHYGLGTIQSVPAGAVFVVDAVVDLSHLPEGEYFVQITPALIDPNPPEVVGEIRVIPPAGGTLRGVKLAAAGAAGHVDVAEADQDGIVSGAFPEVESDLVDTVGDYSRTVTAGGDFQIMWNGKTYTSRAIDGPAEVRVYASGTEGLAGNAAAVLFAAPVLSAVQTAVDVFGAEELVVGGVTFFVTEAFSGLLRDGVLEWCPPGRFLSYSGGQKTCDSECAAGLFRYKTLCVEECPAGWMRQAPACVLECPAMDGWHEDGAECKKCASGLLSITGDIVSCLSAAPGTSAWSRTVGTTTLYSDDAGCQAGLELVGKECKVPDTCGAGAFKVDVAPSQAQEADWRCLTLDELSLLEEYTLGDQVTPETPCAPGMALVKRGTKTLCSRHVGGGYYAGDGTFASDVAIQTHSLRNQLARRGAKAALDGCEGKVDLLGRCFSEGTCPTLEIEGACRLWCPHVDAPVYLYVQGGSYSCRASCVSEVTVAGATLQISIFYQSPAGLCLQCLGDLDDGSFTSSGVLASGTLEEAACSSSKIIGKYTVQTAEITALLALSAAEIQLNAAECKLLNLVADTDMTCHTGTECLSGQLDLDTLSCKCGAFIASYGSCANSCPEGIAYVTPEDTTQKVCSAGPCLDTAACKCVPGSELDELTGLCVCEPGYLLQDGICTKCTGFVATVGGQPSCQPECPYVTLGETVLPHKEQNGVKFCCALGEAGCSCSYPRKMIENSPQCACDATAGFAAASGGCECTQELLRADFVSPTGVTVNKCLTESSCAAAGGLIYGNKCLSVAQCTATGVLRGASYDSRQCVECAYGKTSAGFCACPSASPFVSQNACVSQCPVEVPVTSDASGREVCLPGCDEAVLGAGACYCGRPAELYEVSVKGCVCRPGTARISGACVACDGYLSGGACVSQCPVYLGGIQGHVLENGVRVCARAFGAQSRCPEAFVSAPADSPTHCACVSGASLTPVGCVCGAFFDQGSKSCVSECPSGAIKAAHIKKCLSTASDCTGFLGASGKTCLEGCLAGQVVTGAAPKRCGCPDGSFAEGDTCTAACAHQRPWVADSRVCVAQGDAQLCQAEGACACGANQILSASRDTCECDAAAGYADIGFRCWKCAGLTPYYDPVQKRCIAACPSVPGGVLPYEQAGLKKCSLACADQASCFCDAPLQFSSGVCACPSGQLYSEGQCSCPAGSLRTQAGCIAQADCTAQGDVVSLDKTACVSGADCVSSGGFISLNEESCVYKSAQKCPSSADIDGVSYCACGASQYVSEDASACQARCLSAFSPVVQTAAGKRCVPVASVQNSCNSMVCLCTMTGAVPSATEDKCECDPAQGYILSAGVCAKCEGFVSLGACVAQCPASSETALQPFQLQGALRVCTPGCTTGCKCPASFVFSDGVGCVCGANSRPSGSVCACLTGFYASPIGCVTAEECWAIESVPQALQPGTSPKYVVSDTAGCIPRAACAGPSHAISLAGTHCVKVGTPGTCPYQATVDFVSLCACGASWYAASDGRACVTTCAAGEPYVEPTATAKFCLQACVGATCNCLGGAAIGETGRCKCPVGQFWHHTRAKCESCGPTEPFLTVQQTCASRCPQIDIDIFQAYVVDNGVQVCLSQCTTEDCKCTAPAGRYGLGCGCDASKHIMSNGLGSCVCQRGYFWAPDKLSCVTEIQCPGDQVVFGQSCVTTQSCIGGISYDGRFCRTVGSEGCEQTTLVNGVQYCKCAGYISVDQQRCQQSCGFGLVYSQKLGRMFCSTKCLPENGVMCSCPSGLLYSITTGTCICDESAGLFSNGLACISCTPEQGYVSGVQCISSCLLENAGGQYFAHVQREQLRVCKTSACVSTETETCQCKAPTTLNQNGFCECPAARNLQVDYKGGCACSVGTISETSAPQLTCVTPEQCAALGKVVLGQMCVARSECKTDRGLSFDLRRCELTGQLVCPSLKVLASLSYCHCSGFVTGGLCKAQCPAGRPWYIEQSQNAICVAGSCPASKTCVCPSGQIYDGVQGACVCDAAKGYTGTPEQGCRCPSDASEGIEGCASAALCSAKGLVFDGDLVKCVTKAACTASEKALSADMGRCQKCTDAKKVDGVLYCWCSAGYVSAGACASWCPNKFYINSIGAKVCLAAGQACYAGGQCVCAAGQIASGETCPCDASLGYYLTGSSCQKCATYLSEDGASCVSQCAAFTEANGIRRCCSGASCSCLQGFVYSGGKCVCPELLNTQTQMCVSVEQCLRSGLSAIGLQCVQNGCSSMEARKDPGCQPATNYTQCGEGDAVETCPANVGCYVYNGLERCAVFSEASQCKALCVEGCAQGPVGIFRSVVGGVRWYSYESVYRYYCPGVLRKKETYLASLSASSPSRVSQTSQQSHCEKRGLSVAGESFDRAEVLCPGAVGCVSGGFGPIGGVPTCAAAETKAACEELCTVECLFNQKAGVSRQVITDAGIVRLVTVAPLPPYQCPKGAENQSKKLKGGQVAGIAIGASAALVLIILAAALISWHAKRAKHNRQAHIMRLSTQMRSSTARSKIRTSGVVVEPETKGVLSSM